MLNVKGRFFLGGRLRRSAAKATSCTQRPREAARASCAQASGRRRKVHAWGGVQCASAGAYLAALSLGGRRPGLGKQGLGQGGVIWIDHGGGREVHEGHDRGGSEACNLRGRRVPRAGRPVGRGHTVHGSGPLAHHRPVRPRSRVKDSASTWWRAVGHEAEIAHYKSSRRR